MKVLVIGSGAREHTITWKLAQSPKVSDIIVATGNAGTARIARNLDVNPSDIEGLAKASRQEKVELAVVGPEAPLAAGIVDHFERLGIPIFGPRKAAAEIEASKVFSKQLMHKYGIPCARSTSFSDFSQAKDYVKLQKPPIVIKADGLAAGKGVVVAGSKQEAIDALTNFMEGKKLGDAGSRVLIEECLTGKEMSCFVFTDGQNVVPMAPACDYKRVFDEDRGPNTGGMGSYSPPYFNSPALAKKIHDTIMEPTVKAMAQEKRPYKGVLYGGLIINDNEAKVLEFNARFGDPETQVTLPLLKTDLIDIMLAVINGSLKKVKIEWSTDACVGVVMASAGYPGNYKTGYPITGLDVVDKNILVFHGGTRNDNQGQILTGGGRVLTVVATGKTLAEARKIVYDNLPRINFKGCHYRKDIAKIIQN